MNRKPESALPVMPSAKAPLPAGHIQCAADADCRKPGRMWVQGYEQRQRICIEHYYIEIDRRRRSKATQDQ